MPDRPNPLLHSMVLFWDQIEQALDIVKPHQIVEIGSEGGGNTKLLCDWVTQHDAKLISVDPAFSEAARQLAQQCSQIELVERPSPWGLEGIAGGGAWLIDGDHNYWTVKAELEHAFSTGEPTLAILHDIGWPAGRRDQYYSPGLLPPEAVHPHSFELGVTPWDETSVPGGFRGGGAFAYALREGGDRNGVLTAIEDFAEQRGGLRLVKIPSVFGIGFLFPQDAVWADELSSALSNLERLELLKTLEENRLQLFLMVLELQDRESSVLESARSALSDASAQMAALAAENATIKKQLTHGEAAWPSIGPLTVEPKLGDSQRARRPRVLCYSPYTWIPVHGWWEMTVAKGLLLRGADLSYVVCDGLYSDCDLFWEATNPRPPHACTICQAAVTQRALEMELKLMWLGRYLISEEWEKAKRWAESLSASELFEASYADWPVAEWVTSSVRSHLRRGYPDRSDPHVQAVMRSYLFGSSMIWVGGVRSVWLPARFVFVDDGSP